MDKIRVLQFITPAGFYCAERWVIALANNIDSERVVCDLAVTRESATQDLSVATHYPKDVGDVHYLDMNGRFDFRVVTQLVEVIRKRKIGVIHTHGYKSDIIGLLAARKAGIKCVSTPHGFSGKVSFKLAMFIRVGTFMLRYFDKVAPLSEELVSDMARFNVPASRVQFIRNGVDLKEIDSFLANETENQSTRSKKRSLGYIGQMIPRKCLADLILMFDMLWQRDNQLCLKLIGDGVQRAELEALARSLPCAGSVEFLGFRDDRLSLLREFDIFVMTSSLEGIPRCIMEAMAVRVPVVAYDIPGVDKLVEHGKTGLLAPFGSKAELAQCCQNMLSDPQLAASLAENSRQKIDQFYSAKRMAAEYEELFRSLISG